MANMALNVSTGKPGVSGGIFRAPLGTTLPTDATTSLSGSFTSLGYIATGGVTHSFTLDSGEYRAWGGELVLAYDNSKTHTFQFGMIEVLNPDVYTTIYGSDNVSGTLSSGITVTADGDTMPEYIYVIELLLRGGAVQRIVIPDGKITAVGDIVYQDSGAVSFPVTITAQVDSNGNFFKEYIKKVSST